MRLSPEALAYPAELPITERRQELLQVIGDNQVVVVAGETGSGKSTQLPKMCLELGRGDSAWIGHTQPRRLAARTIAERIAEEVGSEVGGLVGYTVRFTDEVRKDTRLKLMTDGILLAEVQRDRMLRRYDTIIIDEAHERSLNIDFLLGYLRRLLPDRPDLKLIITSATIDTDRFSAHFGDAPIVEVSGRTYPVEIRYRPLADPDDPDVDELDQAQGICAAVEELVTEQPGDILAFCSGEREIRDACDALEDLKLADTEVVPLYARLTAAEQHRVFEPHRGRRIVVATNVAETSLTVPGIMAVIDPGTARISRYSRRTKVQRLPIEPISRASADQRAGRCGRIGPGVCIRLFDEEDFEQRPEFTDPEILRTSLASVILQMVSMGLGDVASFPFVDPPDERAIRDGIALLDELGALRIGARDAPLALTDLGRKLARLPIDPRFGRMLLAGAELGCLREILIVTAGLSVQDPRDRPREKAEAATQMHARFAHPSSDFLSYLQLWEYIRSEQRAGSSSRFRRMCKREFLNYPRVREWQDIHTQLKRATRDLGFRANPQPADPDAIHEAILSGLLSHVGTRIRDTSEYRGARNSAFMIGRGSALAGSKTRWLMAAELVETNRLWGRVAAPIKPEWAERAGGHLVKRSHSEPWWDRGRGAAVAHESVTLFGLPIVGRRLVTWDRVDAVDARSFFIHHALVLGDWDAEPDFAARNQQAEQDLLTRAARQRSAVVLDEATKYGWFDDRIPEHVVGSRQFNKWWRRISESDPMRLDFDVDAILADRLPDVDPALFPDTWHQDAMSFPLHYHFDATDLADGVTVEIPIESIHLIDPEPFQWNVPGFRDELLIALVRSLPKTIRKAFVPIPETVEAIKPLLDPAAGSLVGQLSAALARHGGVAVPIGGISPSAVPPHLQMTFRVLGEDGRPLAEGESLPELRTFLAREVASNLSNLGAGLTRTGQTEWTFGDVARVVDTSVDAKTSRAFPALVDEGQAVGLHLFPTADQQRESMWLGTRRLLLLARPSVTEVLRSLLTNDVKLSLLSGPYGEVSAWRDDVLLASVDCIMRNNAAPAWTAAAFAELRQSMRVAFPDEVRRVGATSARIIGKSHRLTAALDAIAAPRLAEAVDDIASQLGSLVYDGFVIGVGGDRLEAVERYVDAMAYRTDRMAGGPDRDRTAMLRCRALEAQLYSLIDQRGLTPALEDLVWQIQELRVSEFAQPLGTDRRVSAKRIGDALSQARTTLSPR